MKIVWNVVNKMNLKKNVKNNLYLGILILINVVLGSLIWLAIGRMFLPGVAWFACFVGYPAVVVGFFGGVIYLYNHEFS